VRLVQIVTNLLNNAARYTPQKGKISVHCERVGNALELRVEDNGCGISPELLPHVFDAFVQGNRASRRPRPHNSVTRRETFWRTVASRPASGEGGFA
jgi:signal transduction histidine kinase